MSPRQKDGWWVDHVYQGDRPQLTLRVIVCGLLLGGVLSTTNLYIGARIGLTLNMATTSAVLAFIAFRLLSRTGIASDLDVLENNALQTMACSAAYMSSPLTASLGAYMVATRTILPWWQMVVLMACMAALGVTFAIPLKRWFINERRMPFPEGKACGVVLEALHAHQAAPVEDSHAPNAKPAVNSTPVERPAAGELATVSPRAMLVAFVAAAVVKLLQSAPLLARLRLGALVIPEKLDDWYYRLALRHDWWLPQIGGITLRQLTIRPMLDVLLLALGGLIGIRMCASMVLGAAINYGVLAPWMANRGAIIPVDGAVGITTRDITAWSLWSGVAMITAASLWSFFRGQGAATSAFARLSLRRTTPGADPVAHVEIPMTAFYALVPVVGGCVICAAWAFLGLSPWLGLVTIPICFVLTVIAVNATAQTSVTPHGPLGKLMQLACGAMSRENIAANIAAGGLAAETAFGASNFIQSLKPGHMIGAKPRLQAAAHLIGAAGGALVSVIVFYRFFLPDEPEQLVHREPYPAIVIWKSVAEVLTRGLEGIPISARWAALIAAIAGVLMEIGGRESRGGLKVSPLGVGLAFIVPFSYCLTLFAGALAVWWVSAPASRFDWS